MSEGSESFELQVGEVVISMTPEAWNNLKEHVDSLIMAAKP